MRNRLKLIEPFSPNLSSNLRALRLLTDVAVPSHQKVAVTGHALDEFRSKHPRYAEELSDGDLREDLLLFLEIAYVERPPSGDRYELACPLPIWDKLRVVVQSHNDLLKVITVVRRAADPISNDYRRTSYSLLAGQHLLPLPWEIARERLHRFEQSNGRHGWGLILDRKDGRPAVGSYLTTHELLDFYAYLNQNGETLMGRRLEHLRQRLKLPETDGTLRCAATINAKTKDHGLWADPPAPDQIERELTNALRRRLEEHR